ncbi:MAG: Em GEA1 (EM1) [Nitrososphaerota archaeon]|uniref:KGG domain-containing protein n=1 Tax=Candidatus Bathycorpusculum sp. TaxID=2994959 RepID=UPI0028260C4B|nr:Em GEA1 (EM1) [Candidatus Termitimicrobium sp.]MCL2432016.1 Em GEA1 (EM1) [Candidatus Termitimicrobium sp.]MDR0493455.1 Em GEA1 (EM1) [Nitrososphaerota archaeon]
MSVAEAGRLGGQKGGRKTAETHGREFYEEIGHKGGQKVRRLIQEGKAREGK